MTRRIMVAGGLTAAGAAALLVLGAAGPAAAHDSLLETVPAAGESTSAVSEISLTFTDNLLNLGGESNAFAIQVIGPDGRHYSDGCTTLIGPTITAPAALGGAGEYEVLWQVVSADGHPISETYTFDYAPADGTPSSDGASSVPACGQEPTEQDSAAAEEDAPASTASEAAPSGVVLGLSIGAGVAAVVAALTVFLVRRMRRS
ncbi:MULTISPECIES: copper resistance CopC family protein [unclassified Rathayibacter]|uniref:copper resistance CopC family protein n=1 Tax=unclassified Rathayibacter TaxID=2609250 RepID=UPI00188BA0A4|nr:MULTISPECIES: copper resistance CopC family protein [unclassified Rathayibacter]MBF4461950.1 copper resistance protein CopC [Rathayibacter sp. VKM Ac-2879]MBF4504007.1 copper resistance protein CopC [Rathayibacter sp. VKM Ac-2878]